MKKTYLVLSLIVIIFSGCVRDYHPYAQFTQKYKSYLTGERIDFTNQSTEATSYMWDFGDGFTTSTYDASHVFTRNGQYTVTLNAYNHNKVSVSTAVIEVYIPSSLNITVKEYGHSSIIVPNASVLIFETLADWDTHNSDYATVSSITNDVGFVYFDNLFPGDYYIDIKNSHYDNWQIGIDNSDLVHAYLDEGVDKYFSITADYLGKKKSSLATNELNRNTLPTTKYHHRKVVTK